MRQRIRVTFWTEVDDESKVSDATVVILARMGTLEGLSLESVDCEPVYEQGVLRAYVAETLARSSDTNKDVV